ncbi:unnamed protein product [Staurois parvus]|uniref:Uncharacterized protein n=1 Tax=Staurois parvus TaxID=386267 RepID=A0ABN9B047_9NEOB|nr:unnamed protein product [Staurois parvus]
MFTLKKSLLLFFFLGTITLSLRGRVRRGADEEEGDVVDEEVKRGVLDTLKNFGISALKGAATGLLNSVSCKVSGTC